MLGFVVSAWLLERFPELSEGKLSKMKAYLVSESRLVEIAEALDLGSYILLNRGEEKTGGRRKRALLADAYEALIGVMYIDGGIAVAERFLRRELRQKLMSIDPASMIGADYSIELRIDGRSVATGEGHTIKLAQQEAARVALESPDDLIGIAVVQRRNVGVDYASDLDRAVADKALASESFEGEAAPPPEVYGDGQVEDACDYSSAFVAQAGTSSPIGPRDTPPDPELGRDASAELSAEAESEFEARSVTNDV